MEISQLFCNIPPPESLLPARSNTSNCSDLELQEITEFPFDSPEPPQFMALSPTISKLDHQEVVETLPFLDSVLEHSAFVYSSSLSKLFKKFS
ncbi:unnamed protein product [Echinostoma caproni]|uniref:Ovule protein n=1 Tax=Echinostoma caproni TaxID=27848 RepID=A0A183A443_9TREM|nr:unnamed protein product [Echinostoma caproni]